MRGGRDVATFGIDAVYIPAGGEPVSGTAVDGGDGANGIVVVWEYLK